MGKAINKLRDWVNAGLLVERAWQIDSQFKMYEMRIQLTERRAGGVELSAVRHSDELDAGAAVESMIAEIAAAVQP